MEGEWNAATGELLAYRVAILATQTDIDNCRGYVVAADELQGLVSRGACNQSCSGLV